MFERGPGGCIAEDDAVALIQNALTATDAYRVRAHAEECTDCRATVAALARMPSVRRVASVDTAAPTVVVADRGDLTPPSVPGELIAGRYIVGEVIGAGGMGVVYLARDTNLSRMVALKRVRRTRGMQASEEHDRLVHEARMMAQLSHPCVVTVFDAGVADGAAYVAMEHVDGVTLRSWLLAKRRSWREIAAVFAQAAQGLAAAHAAGIVHGDFKPDNVLVDRTGRARVADFGLARAALATRDGTTGELAGTVAYMAPEQLDGQAGDVASDQYAFCVSLYEALHGSKPAEDDATPAPGRGPAWLRRVYERGLAADRAQRYPSMDAIATALARGGRRTGLWIGLVAATLVGAFAIVVAATRATPELGPICRLSEKPSQVWNAKKQTVHAAFTATGKPYAEHAWTTTARTLDRYAESWAAASKDACEATHVHHTQSAELLDLRSACLDTRLAELAALVDVFTKADATVVENAVKASAALTSVAMCADVAGLKEPVPLPADPAIRTKLAAVRAQLSGAKALQYSGKFVEARTLTTEAARVAQELGHRPVEAEALFRQGDLELITDLKASETTLRAALLAAEAGRHPRIAASALVKMSWVFAKLKRFDEADETVRHALSVIEGIGNDEELLGVALHNAAVNLNYQGKTDQARAYYLRALSLREKLFGPDDFRTGATLNNLADLEHKSGRGGEVARLKRRAVAAIENGLGPHHPFVANALEGLGELLHDEGDLDGALAAYKRAVEIRKAVLAPDDMDLASSLNGLGIVYHDRRELDLARAVLLDAFSTYEKAFGPNHFKVGYALTNLGQVYAKTGELAKARSSCRRAVALFEAHSKEVQLASALGCIGEVELAANTPTRAMPPLGRALAIFERNGVKPAAAEAKFRLGQALWRANKNRKRAVILVGQARDTLATAGTGEHKALIEEIRSWLESPSTRGRSTRGSS
jgi:eukaryotic-like serine/threonine-protein kinase